MPRLLLLTAVVALVAAFFGLGLHRQLSLTNLQMARGDLIAWRESRPLAVSLIYGLIYVVVTGLSLPGAAVLTLAGGAVFGLIWGTVIVSLASTLGATLAFLLSRTLLRDLVQRRFGSTLTAMEEGIERDGVFYLLSLRLAPVVPFFVINLVMGLTAMPVLRYALVSQVGMLPGTAVYVNAGTQLAGLTSLSGILSPAVVGSLLLLALFPWLARLAVQRWKRWQLYRPWRRPGSFDRNLIVIGAGSAGLVTAYIAATVKARVTLIERERMGGDCLNTGCVPSKALIRTARLAARIRDGRRYGLTDRDPQVNLQQVLERVHDKVAAVAPHDSVERYRGLGVDVQLGEARLIDPWTVAIRAADGSETQLTARSIVLATGASPIIPAIPGIDDVPLLTSETIWDSLRRRREPLTSLLVLGGGPIGCELAQALAQLGVRVTLVQRNSQLLPREDPEVADLVRRSLERDGVSVHTGAVVEQLEPLAAGRLRATLRLSAEQGAAQPLSLEADQLLCAIGRRARLEGFGLEELGIPSGHTVETDAYLTTLYPNIFAAGDVAGPWQFTHTAAHQAWYAAVNALFDPLRFKVDGRVIPHATFTDPEVAGVGLNETEAARQGVPVEVTRYELNELDRAIVDSETSGMVKVLTEPGKDRILGVSIVGDHAGEVLAEFVLAMRWGLGLGRILGTIHPYPTWVEANKYVAGAWKKAHAPERLLGWVERFHRWRRGGGQA
ncbi:pyridine nucleotide-disulfide oxidoreductase [Synechococcus sp. RSCCF101]|nr:pyridine nucleotide-disulfide oxidoreductase [Synechococcus sp. RSCCF101]